MQHNLYYDGNKGGKGNIHVCSLSLMRQRGRETSKSEFLKGEFGNMHREYKQQDEDGWVMTARRCSDSTQKICQHKPYIAAEVPQYRSITQSQLNCNVH